MDEILTEVLVNGSDENVSPSVAFKSGMQPANAHSLTCPAKMAVHHAGPHDTVAILISLHALPEMAGQIMLQTAHPSEGILNGVMRRLVLQASPHTSIQGDYSTHCFQV